jgi:hypothetical protein
VPVACGTLANRFAQVASGLVKLGLWRAPGGVVAVFEHSARLARHLEHHFTDLAIIVGPYRIPVEGCFMPKAVANPFLEMADFVANTLGKNVKHQMKHDPTGCTANFQALFRDIGPPLADYIEVTAAIGSEPPTADADRPIVPADPAASSSDGTIR